MGAGTWCNISMCAAGSVKTIPNYISVAGKGC
jgi:hypothetical protein